MAKRFPVLLLTLFGRSTTSLTYQTKTNGFFATQIAPSSLSSSKHTFARTALTMSASNDEDGRGISDLGEGSSDRGTTWDESIKISIAKSRKVRGGNYVQIATVDPATREPRCRTVVFRGFLPDPNPSASNPLKMITDARSGKVGEAASPNDVGEIVWWFQKSSEQYRIRGKLVFVGEEKGDAFLLAARKQQWGNLSDSAREQFFWTVPGGEYESQNDVPAGGRGEDGKVLAPPKEFLLMLLYPQRVDYLSLGDNYRQIDEYRQGEWRSKRVNP